MGDAPPSAAHVSYSRQYRRCGKPNCTTCREGLGHGPYWYAVWREGGRVHRRYLGAQSPAEIATAPQSPLDPSCDGGAVVRDPRQSITASRVVPAQSPALSGLQVRTLGRFAVSCAGRAVPAVAWRRRKAGSLFKVLLGAPSYALPREQIEDMLWPEAEPEAATRNLYGAMHTLRELLGSAASCLRLDGELLRLLAPADPAWLDASAFETTAGAALAGQNAHACRDALAMYTGDYLAEDPYEEWALSRRDHLQALRLALLLHLADLAGAQGEFAESEQCLQQVLAQDPCHEEATARLMAILAGAGRCPEALRAYDALAVALSRELGVSPARDLARLHAQLLAQATAPSAAAQPPRQALPARHTNLPLALTSFIGRAQEQQAIHRLLAQTRLLTLTGAGGCGKTRLALHVADGLVDAYPDGVWLVELAAIAPTKHERALVPHAFARVLGVREQPAEPLAVTLTAFLAPRRLLLLVDNCEHVLAACAALLATVLAACPHVQVMATSRERLGVPGEMLFAVPSLPVPPLDVGSEALLTYDAAALFLARAQAAGSHHLLHTPAAAAAIAEICARLDGIPLALELAAARMSTLPLSTLVSRLDASFRLLSGGPRTMLPRQRTLQATLDWSYALLADPGRVLLRRLAAFAGGWTPDAAEAVCADPPSGPARPLVVPDLVLDLLGGLVGQSLVQVESRGGEGRYRFLEPVRQYAAELLSGSDEAALLKHRHLQWFLQMAERAEPSLWGGSYQAAWLARLESDHENCRAALRWALDDRHVEHGLRLACALTRFWHVRGYRVEGYDWLDLLLNAEEGMQAVPPAIRAKALVAGATLAHGLGNYGPARARAEAGLALYRQQGDRLGIATALHVLGNVAADKEQLDAAEAAYVEALAGFRAAGAKRHVANMLSNLGVIACFRRDYDRGIPLIEEAVGLLRVLGDEVLLGQALTNLGGAVMHAGDLTRAAELLDESLRIVRASGSNPETAVALSSLAAVAMRGRQYERAIDLLGQCATLLRGSGDQYAQLLVLAYLMEIEAGLGRAGLAARLYGAAISHCTAAEVHISGPTWDGLRSTPQTVQQVLGEAQFARACANGRTLTIEQAIDLALGD